MEKWEVTDHSEHGALNNGIYISNERGGDTRGGKMTIKPGYGYFDTTNYPVGGCFLRAGANGVPLVSITEWGERQQGCNASGITEDGRKVAFDIFHLEVRTI